MGGKFGFSALLLCLFWNLQVLAEDKCSLGCKGTAQPSFVNGQKYTYSIEGVISIYLTSADKQETDVKVDGQVSVTAIGNCAHILRVNTLHINGNKYGKVPGIEKPIRFTLQDGQLGSDICAEEGDNQRSLNIKRAIISLLQNAHKHNTEVDVFGVCPTEQTSSREGGATLVHRTRDLNRCAHRERGKHDLVTAIYNPHAEIKSSHILQSHLNVESKVKAGIPEKVSSTEEYLLRPYSIGQNGARSKVVTKLVLTGHAAGTDTGAFTVPKSIIFENPHPTHIEQNNVANVLLALKSTAQSLGTDAGSKSAGIFAGLIRIFRATSKADLLSVYSQIKAGGAVKDNNLAKRVYLDALLRTGTGDSIEVSIKLLEDKELTDFEQKLVFLSLGNARHVSNEALKAAATLTDVPGVPREVYLGIGALGGAYCREHGCHGDESQSEGIAAISAKFAAKLGNCKTQNKQEEDTLLAVLKGIRSVRHIEKTLVDKIAHCITDKDVEDRVKAAAFESIHADPCTNKLQKVSIDTLKNHQLDSELRIKAFQALLDCPNNKVANEIKTLLENEPSQQVGRYIASSLVFIRASANPDRDAAKQFFGNIHIPHKFHLDDRKYSFFREFSYNVDALGLGAVAEQSVIYSQDSFLPRSARLNLTTEVFGHSINVLEIGARQGNLDSVVEHYFGPKGVFNTHTPQQIYDYIYEKINALKDKVSQHYRTKRSVQKEIANFAKQIKAESSTFHNELDLDVYVKLFGTDAIFLSLGDDKGFHFEGIIEKIFAQLDQGINKAKNFQNELRAHVLFLDAELAYPTAIGVPLKLTLVGSATSRVQIGANLDIRQIIKDPLNSKVDIQFVPSVNVEIAGSLLADADFVTTGLKVASNLYTSTGGHFIAKLLENGKGIDVQLALPVEKQELLTVNNEIVFVTYDKGQQESEKVLKFDVDRKQYSGCFDQLSGTLGITFCGEFDVPWATTGPQSNSLNKLLAKFPLSGSSKISVRLEKNDLRGYHFKALARTDDPAKRSFELLIEAEGSKTNRKTLFNGELVNTDEEKTVKLALQSPIKSLDGQISIFKKNTEYSALVKAHYDNEEYYGRAGVSISGNERRSVLKPIIEYQLPSSGGKKALQVDGEVIRESQAPAKPGYKYSFNGIKVKLPNGNEQITVDGHVANEANGLSAQLKANKGEHSATISGLVDGGKYNLEVQNTLNPQVNFHIDLTSVREEGHIQNELSLVYGPDLKSQMYRLTASQNLKYHKDKENFNVITKNKILFPLVQLNAKLDAEIDPKKIDFDLEAKYSNAKLVVDLEGRTAVKKPGDYNVKFNAEVNNKGIQYFSKRDIVSDEKSNFENVLTIKPDGSKYELSGVVNHKNKPQDINVGIVGHLKVPDKPDDFKFDCGVQVKKDLHNYHSKVSVGAVDYLDGSIKINRGHNPNGQVKIILKDIIAANGQFKYVDGKGNSALIVDFKKLGRKFKLESNFVAKSPNVEGTIDLYTDFEKDNNQKIHLSTNTKKTGNKYESQNVLEVNGQKTQVNVRGEKTGSRKLLIELILPTERIFSFDLDRTLTDEKGVLNGQAKVVLSDSPKRGASGSSLTYTAKTVNTDFTNGIIHYEGHWDLKLANGKNLDHGFVVKNLKNGDNKYKFDFVSEAKGSLLPKPVSLSVSVDYFDDNSEDLLKQLSGDEKYRLKANYGTEYSIDIDGHDEIQLDESKDKKYVDSWTMSIKLPFEEAHDLKIVSDTVFFVPKSQDKIVEFTVSNALHINSNVYKLDTNGAIGNKNGFAKLKLVAPQIEPFTLDSKYSAQIEGEKKSGKLEGKASYGGKTASVNIEADRANPHEYKLKAKCELPQNEHLKKLEVNLHNKHIGGKSLHSTLTVDADGKVARFEVNQDFTSTSPVLDWHYTSPNGKSSRILSKMNRVGDHHIKAEFKIENIRQFNAAANFDLQSGGTVAIKVDADAPAIKINKVHLDISNKAAKDGQRIDFHATTAGKNWISGSTSYLAKSEGSKIIIEGSGNVKVNEEQKVATFKYIRDIVNEANEQGLEVFLNIALGEISYVFEQRITNLEYKVSNVYCEEKKQCSNAELVSKVTIAAPGSYKHTLDVGVDLRTLGPMFGPEFGIQSVFEASPEKLPQYVLDVHLNQEENKYHLHAYSQPVSGSYPAGVSLTLPKRVIALESKVSYPTGTGKPFPIHGEAALYLNKKSSPKKKAGLRFLLDTKGEENKHSGTAEFGFSHPALSKEVVLKLQSNLVRPTEKSLKIETIAGFTHPAFDNVRESKVSFEISPNNIKTVIRAPSVEILNIDGKCVFEKALQSADLTVVIFDGKPVDTHVSLKEFQKFEFTTGYREQSERKLSIVGTVDPEKKIGVSADIILPSEKKNIFHGSIALQDNQVKTDYGASKENFKYFGNAFKTDMENLGERLKKLAEQTGANARADWEKSNEVHKKLYEAYKDELTKLREEVVNDKILQELSQFVHTIIKAFASVIDAILTHSAVYVQKMNAVVKDMYAKVSVLFEKNVLPGLKELYVQVAELVKSVSESLLAIFSHFAAIVLDFLEKHRAELKELTNALSEIFKDLSKIIISNLRNLRREGQAIFEKVFNEIKELPVFTMIQEKINEFEIPEQVLSVISELSNTIQSVLPTEESKDLSATIFNYILKKLKKEKVNDSQEIRDIYQKLVATITSTIQYIRTQLKEQGLPNLISFDWVPTFVGANYGYSLPALGSFSFSPLNFILNGEYPSPLELIRAYRPRHLLPIHEVPAELIGSVVNGQHIFTFDGRHLTFPGTCRYVLAHDSIDGNFSIIIQLQDGQPKALSLVDKSGTGVDLREDGKLLVNGAQHAYPMSSKDTHAWKEANGNVGFATRYGAVGRCTPGLRVCIFSVSGFYLGKLRGLLGDGNNEEFDDLRLPNGKIVTSESEFGNAYRLTSSCAAVTAPEHGHEHGAQAIAPACDMFYSLTSSLRAGFAFIDPTPFRVACNHAVAQSKEPEREACDLAKSYIAIAASTNLPVPIPQECIAAECKEEKPFKVQLPGNKADIIVAVESTVANEAAYKELLVPVISSLVDELKAKKIDDVKVALFEISPEYPYPTWHDVESPKLKGGKIKFTNPSRYHDITVIKTHNETINHYGQKLAEILGKLRNELGLSNTLLAYQGLSAYKFRTDAVKTTISLVSEPCRFIYNPLIHARLDGLAQIRRQSALTSHLFTVTPNLKIGSGKSVDNVIGFDGDNVLIAGENTKGSEAVRATLNYGNDLCIDSTLKTHGSVFSATNFQKSGQKKQFITAAAKHIAEQLTENKVELLCNCGQVIPFGKLWPLQSHSQTFCIGGNTNPIDIAVAA